MTQFEIMLLTLVFVIAIFEGFQVLLKASIFSILRKIEEGGKHGKQDDH